MNAALAAGLALSCAKAEQFLNEALQFNPESTAILSKHQGKIVAITSTLPRVTILLGLRENNLYLLPADQDDSNNSTTHADTRLTGHANALLLFFLNPDHRALDTPDHYQGSVILAGDRTLVVELLQLFAASRIDREAWLACFIGDVPAHLVGQSLRQFRRHANQARWHGAQAMENFLREEWRANPIARGARAIGDPQATDTDGKFLGQDIKQITDRLKSRLARILA